MINVGVSSHGLTVIDINQEMRVLSNTTEQYIVNNKKLKPNFDLQYSMVYGLLKSSIFSYSLLIEVEKVNCFHHSPVC